MFNLAREITRIEPDEKPSELAMLVKLFAAVRDKGPEYKLSEKLVLNENSPPYLKAVEALKMVELRLKNEVEEARESASKESVNRAATKPLERGSRE